MPRETLRLQTKTLSLLRRTPGRHLVPQGGREAQTPGVTGRPSQFHAPTVGAHLHQVQGHSSSEVMAICGQGGWGSWERS